MTHAIRIHSFGGPEVLRWETVDVPEPGAGQVRVRHTAIGLNFIDTYERTGLYVVTLPAVLGREAAGVVEAVGPRVTQVKVGDRVAYAFNSSGAYSEARVLPAERLVRIPEGVDDRQAAALMLKGMTAQMLLRQVYRVRKGNTLLVHAAVGGVGSILVQWAKHLGATVVAVVGSNEKAQRARELGADHVLLSGDDWVAKTKAATGGRGVDVVYDSVGKDTFIGSLDSLRPRGLMVTYGNASGPVPPMAPLELSKRGSLFLTRPTLFHYIPTRTTLMRAASEMFDLVSKSVIGVQIGQDYPLQDAARAHADLEARRTIGATVLIP
ncbi:MAG TPA: quinone oxidoreductase [Steroidobacteraceae bacterium]|jgi:NADPH2:quinone reductase|nr:quinone oxidoreductase [Steroidobacteraceae bacterium]